MQTYWEQNIIRKQEILSSNIWSDRPCRFNVINNERLTG